jgi:multidrug resistance efflux pump
MEYDKLPPIPTPFSQRWREFRIQVLPFLVFIAALVGIVYLWRCVVQPVGIVGFVETNQVNVASLQDGLISELYVDRFQPLKKDQPICVVTKTDPELINATIQAAKADIQVLFAREGISVARGQQNLQQLLGDLFTEKIKQAARRVDLTLAETNLVSAEALRKQGLESELLYQAALARRSALRDEILERDKYIRDLDQNLVKLQLPDDSLKNAVAEAIRWKEKELELSLKPVLLKATFDGVVTLVHHQAGEKVVRGAPIISLAATNAANVVAYIRQPIQRHPATGEVVQVTTRTTPRLTVRARITKVGAQLEPINPALISAETKRMEVGLPIVVALPPALTLMPGEFVDVSYVSKPLP